MNRLKIILTSVVLAMLLLGVHESAEAQRRKRVKVVGPRKTTVIVRRPHRTVVVRKAHVRYAGLPRWGTVVTATPASAVVIKARRHPYYYHSGIYYAPRGKSYVIVRPEPGIRVRVLPVGYRTIVAGTATYYYYYGTFYSKNAEEYTVIAPPAGAVVDALPEGYDVETLDGNEYYVLDGVYYAEVDAPEFEDGVGYEVIEVN